MGNKEKLLAGAKQCLRERGYARTTARDVVAASGANLASIGYHFGSMERLLTAAMVEGLTDWGDQFEAALSGGPHDLETAWTAVLGSFAGHRELLLASFEAFQQSEHLPELRTQLAAAYEDAREGLGLLFLGPSAHEVDARQRRAVGSVSLAMMTGLITQWLTDPDSAPDGHDVAVAVRLLAARADDPAA